MTTPMTDWTALAKRLEEAEPKDRSDDAEDRMIGQFLCAAYGRTFGQNVYRVGDGGESDLYVEATDGKTVWCGHEWLAPCRSLDATITLIGELLPGWGFLMASHPNGIALVNLCKNKLGEQANEWAPLARARTPALALAVAFCRAMAAQTSP